MPCVVEAVRLRRAPLTTQFVDTLYHRGRELYLLDIFSEFENAFLVIVVCNYKYLQSVFNCFNFMCFQILLLLHVCKITMVMILFRYYNFIYKSLAQEILSHIVKDFAPNLWTVVPLSLFLVIFLGKVYIQGKRRGQVSIEDYPSSWLDQQITEKPYK